MTLTSLTRTDVIEVENAEHSVDATKERRLKALRVDLAQAFKECGPRLFTPHPTFGTRTFVIAPDDTMLDQGICTKHGPIHRSALVERVTPRELDELLAALKTEGYHLKSTDKGLDSIRGTWVAYEYRYEAGDRK